MDCKSFIQAKSLEQALKSLDKDELSLYNNKNYEELFELLKTRYESFKAQNYQKANGRISFGMSMGVIGSYLYSVSKVVSTFDPSWILLTIPAASLTFLLSCIYAAHFKSKMEKYENKFYNNFNLINT